MIYLKVSRQKLDDWFNSLMGHQHTGALLNYATHTRLRVEEEYPFTGGCKDYIPPSVDSVVYKIPGWNHLSGELEMLFALQRGPVLVIFHPEPGFSKLTKNDIYEGGDCYEEVDTAWWLLDMIILSMDCHTGMDFRGPKWCGGIGKVRMGYPDYIGLHFIVVDYGVNGHVSHEERMRLEIKLSAADKIKAWAECSQRVTEIYIPLKSETDAGLENLLEQHGLTIEDMEHKDLAVLLADFYFKNLPSDPIDGFALLPSDKRPLLPGTGLVMAMKVVVMILELLGLQDSLPGSIFSKRFSKFPARNEMALEIFFCMACIVLYYTILAGPLLGEIILRLERELSKDIDRIEEMPAYLLYKELLKEVRDDPEGAEKV